MRHLDLFSGIGGFSIASDKVFGNVGHEFVEYDPFCQAVLKKHWPNSQIHGDIRQFITDTERERLERRSVQSELHESTENTGCSILTGGFPCQPFSHAGRRKGTADDRYLWPEMFRVIQLYKPTWVIAENVRGLVTWNEGMVLEQVCLDLESEGYEVQPLIIPAVAVNAPHRRDRIWIIGHARCEHGGTGGGELLRPEEQNVYSSDGERGGGVEIDTNSERSGYTRKEYQAGQSAGQNRGRLETRWEENWFKVATRLCRVDDGVPRRMDRNPRLKALGNAIVPQVAEIIMRSWI